MLPADMVEELAGLVDEIEGVPDIKKRWSAQAAKRRSATAAGASPVSMAVRRQRSAAAGLRVSTNSRNQVR